MWKVFIGNNWKLYIILYYLGFPGGKEPAWQCRRHKRHGFDPWVGKIPWRRAHNPQHSQNPQSSIYPERSSVRTAPLKGHLSSSPRFLSALRLLPEITSETPRTASLSQGLFRRPLTWDRTHYQLINPYDPQGPDSIFKISPNCVWSVGFIFLK